MKKVVSLMLALAMVAVMAAGCTSGNGGNGGDKNKPELTGTLEEILGKIYDKQSMGDMALETMPIDLSKADDEALFLVKTFSGLDNADDIGEMVTSSPLIGSIAYTLTLVRVKDASNAQAVADKMKAGINPARWVCVWADEVLISGYGDVVMLFMTSSEAEVHAQDLTNAFKEVCGADLDFTVEVPYTPQGGLGGIVLG